MFDRVLPPHEAAYEAALKKLGLQKTNVDGIYVDRHGIHHSVPPPQGKTAAQCERILERLRERMEWAKGD